MSIFTAPKISEGDYVCHTTENYGVGVVTRRDGIYFWVDFPQGAHLVADYLLRKATPMDYVDNYHEGKMTKDAVNNPDHYNNGSIECIEYLKDNMSWQGYTGYLEGNCKKYLHRWRYKQKPIEDLKKARWYLDRLINELETEGTD